MAKEKINYEPRLKKKYREEVQKYLSEKLGIKNVMRIPKIEKVVLKKWYSKITSLGFVSHLIQTHVLGRRG